MKRHVVAVKFVHRGVLRFWTSCASHKNFCFSKATQVQNSGECETERSNRGGKATYKVQIIAWIALIRKMAMPSLEAANVSESKIAEKPEDEMLCRIRLSNEAQSQISMEKLIPDCKKFVVSYGVRLILLWVIFILMMYFQGMCIILSDSYYETGTPPMKDRIHTLVEPSKEIFKISVANTMIAVLTASLGIRIVLFMPFVFALELLIRFLFLESILYFVRSIFIILTTVPCPHSDCVPSVYNTHWEMIQVIVLSYTGIKDTCTDLIVSGHTMSTVMVGIFLMHHSGSYIFNGIVILYIKVILFFIIASKYHYTVDVMFGAILSMSLYFVYYTVVDQYGTAHINGFSDGKTLHGIIPKIFATVENIPERIRLGHQLSQVYTLTQRSEVEIKEEDKVKIERICRCFGVLNIKELHQLYRGNKEYNFHYFKVALSFLKRKNETA
ncbi:hypothetical protein BEWA_006840 [Theileria equi strain WA]|uniref:Sphingomyelin synthase-like domain-containing protein n=1 Tax=Theileria equi strain WA TaxID=1537102 RepID=L0B0D1_THEEQ|nr:hypothetical protein BEWA_006840 [Theileria equi strain WA]AFZ81275.1 hypothetical protein BEWA_006840 [Theileria equi strain WA]|eukprot:XP_004830941.1 hypothetical protein BEWA_006840 [Theileria equi strain WA]